MDKAALSKRIGQISEDVEKLKNTLAAIENVDFNEYPENYKLLTTDAALRSEQITCRLRHLLYQTAEVKKAEYLASAGVVQGIRIEEQDGVLEITLPCLLPKRKKRSGGEFLTDPLYFTFSRYADSHPLTKYRHCVVCFSHIYAEDFATQQARDYDNLEWKQLLDVIASYVMEDDSGLLIDAYNTTEVGTVNGTRISVMAPERFPRWLEERKNSLKSISDF